MIKSRARQTALLLLAAISRKIKEHEANGNKKKIHKASFTTKAIINASGFLRLHDTFVRELIISLENYGWHPIFIRDEIIVIRIDTLTAPKIALKRVDDLLQAIVKTEGEQGYFEEKIIFTELADSNLICPPIRTTSVSST